MVVLLVVILLSLGLYVIKALPRGDEAATPSSQIEAPAAADTEDRDQVPTQRYSDPEIGLSFSYTSGTDGYVLDTLQGTGPDSIKTLRLMTTADSTALDQGGAHDGPPTMLIQIFETKGETGSEAWAEAHLNESNIHLKIGEIEETKIAGADAVRYTVDGLYRTDTVVVLQGDFAYVISGSYLDLNSPTKKDLDPLLHSIEFTPS